MFRSFSSKLFVIQSQIFIKPIKNQLQSPRFLDSFTNYVNPSIQYTAHLQFCTHVDNAFNFVKVTSGKVKINPTIIELEKSLQCTESEAISAYIFLSKNADHIDLKSINKTVKWFRRSGAETSIIVRNCHLFLVPLDRLKRSYERLKRSQWRQYNDFLPLLSISESVIRRIQKNDSREIRKRIYMFSECFSNEPQIVSHYCAKHLFMLETDMELLKRKITLLKNNISSVDILRDLNILARGEGKMKDRIEYLRMCGIGLIKPWMLKCEDDVLHRAIEIRTQFRGSGIIETMELLIERLDCHGKTATSLFTKNKFLGELNHETAGERMEELLKVFTPKEIIENIYLLRHPVEHIKIRVEELIALDASNISPRVCGMSEKQFIEYMKSMEK